MAVSQPFVVTSPDVGPPGREWWLNDPTAGPEMSNAIVSLAFYGWSPATLNLKLLKIKDEYDIPRVNNGRKIPGRKFRLYDVERMTRLFLARGIIDYRRFYNAQQILVAVARNYNLI
jgi:hypothetical protein